MLKSIINQQPVSSIKKQVLSKLASSFEGNLPDSLYLNPYELIRLVPNSNANDWKEFLKIPEINRFIESEIATIAEAAARKALQNLQENPNSSDIQAAKELLSSSKLLKQKMQNRQTIFMHYIPQRSELNDNQQDR